MEEMNFKVTVASIVFLFALFHRTRAGVISLEADALDEHAHVSLASSYMHFYGPVEGPEFEVKVPYVLEHDEHNDIHGQDHEDHRHRHGYTIDYVAHPKYQFSYGVEDHHTGDFHSQKESRDGSDVSGEYSVKEPGGTVRVVSYRAGKDGFHAVVHTSGKNDHSSGHYGTQSHIYVQTQAVDSHQQEDSERSVSQDDGSTYADEGLSQTYQS